MKVTVNVDCTPDEARHFFGLPDVRPMQEEMMKIMRAKTMENLKMMEPEKMMAMWGPMMSQGMNQGMGQMNEFFKSVMTGTAKNTGPKTTNKK
jgi:hypothetical protein